MQSTKLYYRVCLILLSLLAPFSSFSQNEPFTMRVVVSHASIYILKIYGSKGEVADLRKIVVVH